MSGELCLRNHQRTRPVDMPLLRRLIHELLSGLLRATYFDLTVHLVDENEMVMLNETAMRHAGTTDVITFDYCEPINTPGGELFVCVDEAVIQARRFRTTWQEELARYIIHGVLHLRGHDDLRPAARQRMKREEARLLKELGRRFRLSKLRRKPKVSA